MKRFNSLFAGFFLLTFFLSGCVSKTVQEGGLRGMQWESKALVKNLKENKTQSVTIDIYTVKDIRARFEVTALLGFQVASVVMSPQEISYTLYPQKTFYYGKNSERTFAKLLGLPLHPMNLTNIAHDEPVRGLGWACELDIAGFISRCENAAKKIKIQWSDRKEGQKKVVITSPQFEMQWHFSAPKTEVQFKPELFTLRQPEGFKAIQLN